MDDTGRVYALPISGTTDNSLFTNFHFFQRCVGEFQLVRDDDNSAVRLDYFDEDEDVNSQDGGEGMANNNTSVNNISTTVAGGG